MLTRRRPTRPSGLSRRRRWVGLLLALVGLPALTVGLTYARHELSLDSILLLYLLAVVLVVAVGGWAAAAVAALAAVLLTNWYLVPPYHTWHIDRPDSVVALVVFLLVAATVSAAVEVTARLRAEAEQARRLAEIDELRSALLAAVGHDLRTPLAGIKAAVSSLRQHDVRFTEAETEEFLASIEESADRLNHLLANLLDMSRLQAGVFTVDSQPVNLDEAVARTLIDEGSPPTQVRVAEDLPMVRADPVLLERVLANLLANAHRYGGGTPVLVSAHRRDRTVQLSVADHGDGVDPALRPRMFAPFQRLDDRHQGGVGLGLAIARGFTDAMGGVLAPSTTPGGGVTMTVTLPVWEPDRTPR